MAMQNRQPSRINEAIEILRATHDGEDLDPSDLAVVHSAVNHNLTEEGVRIFDALHQQAISGTYQKPWRFNIEHLTIDHIGNVRWRDHPVEHYSFYNDDSVARLRLGSNRTGTSLRFIRATSHHSQHRRRSKRLSLFLSRTRNHALLP